MSCTQGYIILLSTYACFIVSIKIVSKTIRDTYQEDHFDLTATPDLYH